ncbi:FAD-binding oxidoreductase [Bradyrhizobium sp. sBnM-33]|uniref:FAD-binding oxidoreductase n=1 Tax=Bradyrhizobium sp. sBnM-33 TaxID=2831780 RepID=UPI001BCD5FA8|nr:FAD-binding oxidoreductase [Bradyrhizobium sp. sBnM-33]WOH48412.1 FAD-binding oxidoreductase [Bradyrhizobium sp. sBnM-33]
MDALNTLKATLTRPGLLISDPQIVDMATTDFRGWYKGNAVGLARPRSVSEVQDVVRACRTAGCAIVAQGGNTSMCGGAVPAAGGPSLILSTLGLDKIRSVSASSWSLVAEAGCSIKGVQDAARSVGQHFGLDFGARDSATIGGAISTNAGGMNVVRYGNCRDQVLGLEVVLADGTLWNGLRSLRKDNSGFDIKQLFIGGEGTLGIIAAASLKLHPAETESRSALLAVQSLQSATDLADLAMELADGRLSAIELLPRMGVERVCQQILGSVPPIRLYREWYVLVRMAGQDDPSEKLEAIISRALERDWVSDAIIAQSSSQEAKLWLIRDSFSELHRYLGVSFRFDYSVPLGRIPKLYPELCEAIRKVEPHFLPFAFGHLGDGNLHFSACQPDAQDGAAFEAKRRLVEDEANRVVWSLGGSVSAEHGIGQLHRDELVQQKGDVEVNVLRRIKNTLNPSSLLNPHKTLPA